MEPLENQTILVQLGSIFQAQSDRPQMELASEAVKWQDDQRRACRAWETYIGHIINLPPKKQQKWYIIET